MKKKGLIISTVVMVVVLIASLTTATYAWFNATAAVKVDSLNIQTVASQGLQIAMVNNAGVIDDNIVSGEMTYDATQTNKWSGEEGWGQYLGFGGIEIGQMEHAVTKSAGTDVSFVDGNYNIVATDAELVAGTTYYFATPAPEDLSAFKDGITYYTKDTSANKYMKVTGEFSDDAEYYTVAVTTDRTTEMERLTQSTTVTDLEGFIVPTGYDSSNEPTGFAQAQANEHYYELTMAVQNTSAIGSLGMGIMVVDSDKNGESMVAASRLEIEIVKQNADGSKTNAYTTLLKPYDGLTLQNNGIWKGTSAGNMYKFMLDKAESDAALLAQGQVYFVTIRIWVEGTDSECTNRTAGTGFDVNIEFNYTENTTGTLVFDTNNTAEAPTAKIEFPTA